jgi:hypothetical protein
MNAVEPTQQISSAVALKEIEQKCKELAITEPENTQKIAADLLAMGKGYYHDACSRAQQSFKVALGAAVVGMIFFFVACGLVMKGGTDRATLAALAGTTIEALSGIVFVLHFKAVKQFGYFHVCLERMTRFMVANSVVTNIRSSEKSDETRSLLVKTMLEAPMLPLFESVERQSKTAGLKDQAIAKGAFA